MFKYFRYCHNMECICGFTRKLCIIFYKCEELACMRGMVSWWSYFLGFLFHNLCIFKETLAKYLAYHFPKQERKENGYFDLLHTFNQHAKNVSNKMSAKSNESHSKICLGQGQRNPLLLPT